VVRTSFHPWQYSAMKNIYSHFFYWTAEISQQMSLQQFTQNVQDGVFQTHKTEPHHQVQYFYLSVTWNVKWVMSVDKPQNIHSVFRI
jgi:hypothetical protein